MMGIFKGLGSILKLPIKGARAGGQAIIDIFDSDEPDRPQISDEEFDRWARSVDQSRYGDDYDDYGTGRSLDLQERRQAMQRQDKERYRDPEVYGTGDPDFETESDRRFALMEREADAKDKQNILYLLDVLNNQRETKQQEKAHEMDALLRYIQAQKARNNPLVQALANSPQEQQRSQSVAATVAPRRY